MSIEDAVIEHDEKDKTTVSKKPDKKKTPVGYLFSGVREVIAVLFWVYVLTKLFLFDIDVVLVNKLAPEYAWLLYFKFFILIAVLAIIWLVTKNKHILSWSLFICFYPAITLFWRIPAFIFKQRSWVFAFACINVVISFFKSIKYNFVTAALFLVSLAIIFGFSNKKLLWPATVGLLIILTIIYIHRFILVFKPSSVFQMHIKIFAAMRKHGVSYLAPDQSTKNVPVANLDQKQLEKWTTNLQTSVLFNRICLFAARKLRDNQSSGLNVLSSVLTILVVIMLTVLSFAAINYGLYKIDARVFSCPSMPTVFVFFYYSFNNLVFNSIREIVPIATVTQLGSMIESFFALFLVGIFVSLLFSVRSQKYAEELNEAIEGIEKEGLAMEEFIRDEYKINSIKDAMAELEKLKAGLVSKENLNQPTPFLASPESC